MFYALINNHTSVVQLLLTKKPFENNLSTLVMYKSIPDIEKLLKKKPGNFPLNISDYDCKTELHYACQKCLTEMVEFLINNGSNMNYQDKFGNTPFHYLTTINHIDIIKIFIKKGFNILTTNQKEETLYDILIKLNNI